MPPLSAAAALKARQQQKLQQQQQQQPAGPPAALPQLNAAKNPANGSKKKRKRDAASKIENQNRTSIRESLSTYERAPAEPSSWKPILAQQSEVIQTLAQLDSRNNTLYSEPQLQTNDNSQTDAPDDEELEDGEIRLWGDSESEGTFDSSSEDEQARKDQIPISQAKLRDIPLSTVQRKKEKLLSGEQAGILVHLRPGDFYTAIGQYDLRVRKGSVRILGAVLYQGPSMYRVYAPSTHSLPQIECRRSATVAAEVELYHCKRTMRSLGKLSPRFGRIWTDQSTKLAGATIEACSFSPLYTSAEDPLKRPLEPLVLSSEWESAVPKLCDSSERAPVILVCGPKSSGKSTFSRILSNFLLTVRGKGTSSATTPVTNEPNARREDGVALLDLDPGQPEFSPPGHVSLVHLRSPNFGPPYTHPVVPSSGGSRMVRAHSLASITPSENPVHYMDCALDLMNQYYRLRQSHPTCPIVINCPGWILGPGVDIMVEFIQRFNPTAVAYMSDSGLSDIMQLLKDAAGRAPFYRLPSQPSQIVARTPKELRMMQTLSYFHMDKPKQANFRWDSTPLTSVRPWVVQYQGANPGIAGILVLGETQPPELLSTILDGALASVVVLEDDEALPGTSYLRNKPKGSYGDLDAFDEYRDARAGNNSHEEISSEESEDGRFPKPLRDHPLVYRTQAENLPYISNGAHCAIPPDPSKSHTLGLALIRGIDVENGSLHLLTPITHEEIVSHTQPDLDYIPHPPHLDSSDEDDLEDEDEDQSMKDADAGDQRRPSTQSEESQISGVSQASQKSQKSQQSQQSQRRKRARNRSAPAKSIILVLGRLDTPDWAYQEDYAVAAHTEKRRDGPSNAAAAAGGRSADHAVEESLLDAYHGKVPWIRVLRGREGKAAGDRVWRATRHLRT